MMLREDLGSTASNVAVMGSIGCMSTLIHVHSHAHNIYKYIMIHINMQRGLYLYMPEKQKIDSLLQDYWSHTGEHFSVELSP